MTGLAVLVDESFDALGTTCRVVVEAPDAEILAARLRSLVEDHHRRLSRFIPGSELCALNADPRERVPVSPALADAVRAALWAAGRSGGLVDPTLLDQLERAGYRESLTGRARAPWTAPEGPPRPARPHPREAWREIRVEDGFVLRPPGLRLDLGGSAKGHIADLAAHILAPAPRWAVDCGGDVRVGGDVQQVVLVEHPFRDDSAATLTLRHGAVATSSIHARAWRGGHHLLDPATGEPAWTGVIAATATAPTTLEAETLAKVAVLGGPEAARRVGAVAVGADGAVLA